MMKQAMVLGTMGGFAYMIKTWKRKDYTNVPLLCDTTYAKHDPAFAPLLIRYGCLDQPDAAHALVRNVDELLTMAHEANEMRAVGGRSTAIGLSAHKKINFCVDLADSMIRRAQQSRNVSVVQACVECMEESANQLHAAFDSTLHNILLDTMHT